MKVTPCMKNPVSAAWPATRQLAGQGARVTRLTSSISPATMEKRTNRKVKGSA